MASGCPLHPRPPLRWRLAFLISYSLHNGWNCWVFLNFTNFGPARTLLRATDEEVGFITTMGWIGILSTLPIVVSCPWQRVLLVAACLVNTLAPILRFLTADVCYSERTHLGGVNQQTCNYPLIVLSSYLQGAAFGVLGAWPSLLGAQWPPEQRTLVTAIASLSNYVGGAAGTTYMPACVASASGLLGLFRWQAVVSGVLALTSFCFFRLPPVVATAGATSGNGATVATQLGLRERLRGVARGRAPFQLVTLGLLVGLSLVLQGMLPFVLSGVGYSDVQSGLGTTVYQSRRRRRRADRQPRGGAAPAHAALRGLHAGAGTATAAVAVLCWSVGSAGDGEALAWDDPAVAAMLGVTALLGATLMGALPFCLQQVVLSSAAAGENLVSGLLYLVAMPAAAGLTQLCASLPPLPSLGLVGGLVALELALFFGCDPQSRLGKATAEVLLPECREAAGDGCSTGSTTRT